MFSNSFHFLSFLFPFIFMSFYFFYLNPPIFLSTLPFVFQFSLYSVLLSPVSCTASNPLYLLCILIAFIFYAFSSCYLQCLFILLKFYASSSSLSSMPSLYLLCLLIPCIQDEGIRRHRR